MLRRLLKGGAYFDESVKRCGAYFETWYLLEEIWYILA